MASHRPFPTFRLSTDELELDTGRPSNLVSYVCAIDGVEGLSADVSSIDIEIYPYSLPVTKITVFGGLDFEMDGIVRSEQITVYPEEERQ